MFSKTKLTKALVHNRSQASISTVWNCMFKYSSHCYILWKNYMLKTHALEVNRSSFLQALKLKIKIRFIILSANSIVITWFPTELTKCCFFGFLFNNIGTSAVYKRNRLFKHRVSKNKLFSYFISRYLFQNVNDLQST